MRGYKVVEKRGEMLLSCVVCTASELEEGTMEYKVGEAVKPKDGFGPLAVFSSYMAARDFVECNMLVLGNWRIFACEYEESGRGAIWIGDDVMTAFHRRSIDSLPQGTRLASEVTLLEEVKE
jgi:hypothetical protein